MAIRRTILELAANYHHGLPHRVRKYLNDRGIPDVLIDFHLLGWNGWRITIPVFNREGEFTFFKLARDPEEKTPTPKMIASPGAYVELYGWEHVVGKPSQIIICEGEFDRFVLEAKGFRAVTSTGGAGTFRLEWAKDFEPISEVYICFDRDEAGKRGALRVGRIIPHSKIIELPEEVGDGGDVTDYFVRLGHSREDFLELLTQAKPAPPEPEPEFPPYQPRPQASDSILSRRIEQIKIDNPIAGVVGQYLKLQQFGSNPTGLCPFHDDHNPSLVVYPATGTFHCYGCGKHGDVITFIRDIERLSFGQALDALDQLRNQHGAENQ